MDDCGEGTPPAEFPGHDRRQGLRVKKSILDE